MSNRIIRSISSFLDRIRDFNEALYRIKHHKDGAHIEGWWQCDQWRNSILMPGSAPEPACNLFTTEGMAWMNNILFYTTAKTGSKILYVHLFKNNVTPALSDVCATSMGATGTYGVCQDADYSNPATNAPLYDTASTTTATITNSASKAAFIMAAGINVYGALLSTSQAKSATDGVLVSAKRFTASRAVLSGDELDISVSITFTSS